MKKNIIFIFMFIYISAVSAESLKVAAVQLEINDFTYSSYEQFKREMEKHVRNAKEAFHPDFIIFPEYTSVFPAVTPYYSLIGRDDTIEEIFLKVHEQNKDIRTLFDLFAEEAGQVDNLLAFWGELSQKYNVTILGGSYFAFDGTKLTNRLVIYGPGGDRIYEQDKFFLTPFESDLVGISPGRPDKPEGIFINGRNIVFTICRDTFLDRWEPMYQEADLWIDIKANGESFKNEQRELFLRALPARMKSTSVPYGATVCLTGSFLELFWEGESSFIKRTDKGVQSIISSRSFNSGEIIYFIVD